MATFATLKDYPFLQMVASMPNDKVTLIYKSVPSVLFTVNMLHPKVKDLISYMLTVTALNVDHMVPAKSISEVRELVKLLTELRIVCTNEGLLFLDQNFRQSFVRAISQRQRNTTKLVRLKEGQEKIKKLSTAELFQKGNDRWDLVLKYLISNTSGEAIAVSGHTISMFKQLQFIRETENGGTEITSKGFQFLLQGRYVQTWQYLSAFLMRLSKSNPDQAPDIIDLFASLVMLSPAIPPTSSKSSYFIKNSNETKYEIPYRIPEFSHDIIQEFFLHMRELGFIHIRKRKDGYFYVTPALSMLSSCGSTAIDSLVALTKSDGYLVVESNYRVYAYTNDELQLSILNTFTDPDGAFADMIMAVITRNSVRRAFELGITAAQIVAFMRSNSHQLTIEKFGMNGCVPQTVIDQIQLWEIERYRFNHCSGIMYASFSTRNEFLSAVEQAKRLDCLLWSSTDRNLLIIKEENHEEFKQWFMAKQQRMNSGGMSRI
ncbi:hypothetical protein FO519_001556 [Halicephalobus sp. NKZ332]|nr:hypothetical protein FO519_001556 [Halicephalobus sp. NKZ332]